jgi:hypothetical protein
MWLFRIIVCVVGLNIFIVITLIMQEVTKSRSIYSIARGFLWTCLPRTINNIYTSVNFSKMMCRRIYNKICIKDEIIFLHTTSMPLLSSIFGSVDNTSVKWRCSIQPPVFIDPGLDKSDLKHISYLALVLKIKNQTDIDLSTWVNEVKWAGSVEPTLRELFTLWSYETGNSYFHCINDILFEIIDENGNIIERGLND